MAFVGRVQTGIVRRRATVRRLRAGGMTIRAIAAELHCGQTTVVRDLAALNGDRPGSPVVNAAGPANGRAVTHGALSQALVRPRAAKLEPQILGAHKHLDAGRDSPAIKRYCVVLARIELVYDWLDGQEHAVFTDADTGTVHAVYTRLQTWERQASELEAQLALSPLTRVKLGLDQARGRSLVLEMQDAARGLEEGEGG